MKRIIWQAAIVCTLTAIAWLGSGCDDAKDADLPSQPYHLVRTYPLEGTAEDVSAHDGYVAVAGGAFGAVLYNSQRPDSLYPVFTYRTVNQFARATHVAFNATYTVFAVFTDREPETMINALFNFSKDAAHASIELSPTSVTGGPLAGFDMEMRQDTIIFWGTDTYPLNDYGIRYKSFENTSDTTTWTEYGRVCIYQPPRGMSRGFERRLSDGAIAVANDETGIYLFNPTTCDSFSMMNTPGIAYDCAWAGNYVMVADQYSLVIIDATDLRHPTLASALTIATGSTSTAHRLRKVTVDGHYACLADDIEGIYIVDISDPRNPVFLQRFPLYDPTNVSASNGMLFATSSSTGLYVFQR